VINIHCTKREAALWHALLDLAERETRWVLIGARMVELHALQAGRALSRASPDGDALADARARPNPVRRMAQLLVDQGFELIDFAVLGTGHTFRKGDIEIDVLAPEHLGANSEDARTTVPPLHTVEVPGGRQAIDRGEWVEIEVNGRRGRLPRPGLLGAILIKARAVDIDDTPETQRQDLALLLSLVDDPETLMASLHGTERGWLKARAEMNSEDAGCWIGMSQANVIRGLAAVRILGGL